MISLLEFFCLEDSGSIQVHCKRCEILDDMKSTKTDRRLHPQERAEALSDLGADLKNNQTHAPQCKRKD